MNNVLSILKALSTTAKMLSDWDIQQYSERTMQKEGFEAGAKWARDCFEKEKGIRGVSTFLQRKRKDKLSGVIFYD